MPKNLELRLFLIGKNMDLGGFSQGVNRGKSGFVVELSFYIYSCKVLFSDVW